MKTAVLILALTIFLILPTAVLACPKLNIPNEFWEPLFFKSIDSAASTAGLEKLRSKCLEGDSEEVRIWIGFGLTKLEGILLVRNKGESKGGHMFAKTAVAKMKPPKNGWDSLWKKLEKQGLYTLPDSSTLKNSRSIRDGVSYVVEYSRGGEYRTYEYGNPQDQPWPEGKKLIGIIKLIRDEFGIPGFFIR